MRDTESGGNSGFHRKRSLIRPERNRIDPNHPNYYYRRHARQNQVNVQPSTTGNEPILEHAPAEEPKISPGGAAAPTKKQKARRVFPSPWRAYCNVITFWAPSSILACFGMPNKKRQGAWREKIGIIFIILLIGAFVGFLTFGFTQTVCGTPSPRFPINQVNDGYLIINGRAYDFAKSAHPAAVGVPAGSNILYPPVNAAGMDASFLFQNVNSNCKGIITPASGSKIPTQPDGSMAWYFPCQLRNQDGSSSPNPNAAEPYLGYACHTTATARNAYYSLNIAAEVYFTWDDVKNSSRQLIVYSGNVVDLSLVNWFDRSQVVVPDQFDTWAKDRSIMGQDMTMFSQSSGEKQAMNCLVDIARVGSIDTETVGCIASQVVLYLSLVFIVSIVTIKFLLAVFFSWFLSWRRSATRAGAFKDLAKRNQEIEDWSNDIYTPAPHIKNANRRTSHFFPTTSRFTSPYATERPTSRHRTAPTTMGSQSSTARLIPPPSLYGQVNSSRGSIDTPSLMPHSASHSSLSLAAGEVDFSPFADDMAGGAGDFVHESVVPQPPPEFQPFNFPLAHCICLVTAYSESFEGVRTTLDSVATSDYPNSHKFILVICDGVVRGHGNKDTTPDMVLSMMKDFATHPASVKAHSYVAVASGTKRHNMAKVYSGFYDYDDATVDPAKQQRVPMMLIVKCGTPAEAAAPKPGNRGKRDSQIILMSFLQKVIFDERMTELEFEIFNSIWKVTGMSPDFYEMVLMVDADTKIFPDSLTHMISAMVYDPEVMGLCGETKIANKTASWISMMQVFEYFISHHMTKSFESVFGGVTCLPGCFCMYRIKAPKGPDGYWVPILSNPDVVEHYSENVVETLHDKNLLLLGEDRYLSTLMLKTFPKRKQVFIPQAVCKTVVPDEFKVLLSQRRRWINSTVHNLMELVLVRDLCGTFCFSMQFVVFIELVGTLVLPAAIAFTFYLIIISIVAKPVPVIPLILLALILGLPGVLIVITAHRASYIMWMAIYLVSLPIWNFVLPVYAYWHMDEFSWGDTRKVEGQKSEHEEAEGEFDSTHIVMKKWKDFERDRRRKEARSISLATMKGPEHALLRKSSSHSSDLDRTAYGN